MRHPKKRLAEQEVVPSQDFTRFINGLRGRDLAAYKLVLGAQLELMRSPKRYVDDAYELESHVDAGQLWVTVKDVRFLIRDQGDQLLLDHFVLKRHLR